MTSMMLRREVERVFEQHSLADTGAAYDFHIFPKGMTSSFWLSLQSPVGEWMHWYVLQDC